MMGKQTVEHDNVLALLYQAVSSAVVNLRLIVNRLAIGLINLILGSI